MLVIFSAMIVAIKITYDVFLCDYWNLAEEAHTNIWESNLAQYQPAAFFVMRKPHGEWKSLLKSFFSYRSRNHLARETIIIITVFFYLFFPFIVMCAKRKSMIRVTSQSQSISSIVANNKHLSLGFYWCLKIVQKNHTKIYMLACDYCWKSMEKTKPWIPSICFWIEYPDYNSKFIRVNLI